jgi:Fe-S cluster assembly protein SufD
VSDHGSTSVAVDALSRGAVDTLSERFDEPSWMAARRRSAWESFERLPEPLVTQPEVWRRTDVRALDISALTVPAAGPRVAREGRMLTPEHFRGIADDPANRAGLIRHTNGVPVGATLDPALASRGVIFTDLASAARSHADLVREHLHSVAKVDEHRFRALQAAMRSAGTLLYVPAGVEVALPLMTVTSLEIPGGAIFPHTLVIAEPNSQVTLIEMQTSTPHGSRTLATATTELIARAGARVRYVSVQEWGAPMWEVGSLIRAHAERDATLHSLVVAMGGSLVKADIESRLLGVGATSEMLGVYFGDGTQHMDFNTLQEHRAPSTLSELLYKGAIKDTARTVFAGLIKVDPGAQKTNAFQSNRNLILSAGARSDSIPKLEIMANDLRCTHGSATSQLNEEHIFYLMSRGLSRHQATLMIVTGFFSDLFDRMPVEQVREYVQARVSEKMS